MRASLVAAKADKALQRERELSHSKSYPYLGITLAADCHFVEQRQNNAVSYVIEKQKYDVVIQRHKQFISKPSLLYSWLAHFNPLWNDGVGVLSPLELTSLISYLDLQNAMERSGSKTESGGSALRQDVSRESSQASEGVRNWTANPLYDVS